MIPILDILNIGGKIIDKIFPDATAAEQAKLKLLELQQSGELAKMQADMQEQGELTKRQENDMKSDSWLSKNIRTNKAYVELLGQWGMLIMSFYFGGRTLEKIMDMRTTKSGNTDAK